jgi:hypothetical protein
MAFVYFESSDSDRCTVLGFGAEGAEVNDIESHFQPCNTGTQRWRVAYG